MINLIVAMTKDRVIGKDNQMPWHISEDLKNFKRLTTGNTVIMGRNTYFSLGKPLPNRNNIVISHEKMDAEGVDVCYSIDEALEKARSYNTEIFIIGGAMIYKTMLAYAERLYISYVKKDYDGDTYFPEFNEDDWVVESRQDFEEFEFVVYIKKQSPPADQTP